jgi:hypothetical protein
MEEPELDNGGGVALNTKSSSAIRKQSKQTRKMRHKRQFENFKARLCELGWRKSFIDVHVDSLVGQDLDEQHEEILMETMAKEWVLMYHDTRNTSTMSTMLYDAGFTRKMANKLSEVIAPLRNTCYTCRQLLDIAIEYAVGRYDKVLPLAHAGYYVDTQEEVWVPHAMFKYVYNAPILSRLSSIPTQHVRPQHKLFFHATNYRSALNILQYGISHSRGRPCLDFGIKSSFYMTPELSIAIAWCDANRVRWKGELCIMMFSIPTSDSLQALSCKLYEAASAEWVKLVTESRRCKVHINELDRFDAVYGPMASNVQSMKNNALARPHRTLKYQLASKSDASDMYFRNCYEGTIFARV